MGPCPRRAQPVHLRWQHLADVRRDEPYGHDRGSRPARRGPPDRREAQRADFLMSTAEFDVDRRAVLAAVADVLIPKADGMPSASEAGVAGRWLDEVLRLRPDFGPPLAAVLDGVKGVDSAAALARLRSDDPAGFGVLAEVVAGGYFLNPEVRSA